jgi:hypothetical protein
MSSATRKEVCVLTHQGDRLVPMKIRRQVNRRRRESRILVSASILVLVLALLSAGGLIYVAWHHIRRSIKQCQTYLALGSGTRSGVTNSEVGYLQKCRRNPIQSPDNPRLRTISRTASRVFGGLTNCTPLLAAMLYSNCLRTCQNIGSLHSQTNWPSKNTLTSSKASFTCQMFHEPGYNKYNDTHVHW